MGGMIARFIRAVLNSPQRKHLISDINLNYTRQPLLSISFEYNTLHMTLSTLLARWRSDPQVGPNLVEWRRLPGKKAQYEPFPSGVHPLLKEALEAHGIRSLYTHQASAFTYKANGSHELPMLPSKVDAHLM